MGGSFVSVDGTEDRSCEPEREIETAAGRNREWKRGKQGEGPVSGEGDSREWEGKDNWQNRGLPERKESPFKCSVETGEKKGRGGEAAAEHGEAAAESRGHECDNDRQEEESREPNGSDQVVPGRVRQ